MYVLGLLRLKRTSRAERSLHIFVKPVNKSPISILDETGPFNAMMFAGVNDELRLDSAPL